MRALIRAAALALVLAAPLPALAGRLVDVEIVDRDTGMTLPTVRHDGRSYIAGKPGHRYAVRLVNRTGGRVLTVLSVDGVNAVTGETASPMQNGYVLDPWESTEINGWRKSLDEIAQFNFTALPDSYAARTGRPANVGVIGVAVFEERIVRRPPPPRHPAIAQPAPPMAARDSAVEGLAKAESAQESHAAGAPPAARPAAPRERLGTGHGEREWSRVATTTFQRATLQPAERIAIEYDSRTNLVARGILPQHPIAQRAPDPFPNGFVADPPRWR
ncbi:MAG TPA: hypothetical protein PKO41_00015 [Dokdonella sp.]|uniref:hypothetical protein n=1 Tax=Dokdonella sp. TaxID=2291710 RepID=UPI0025B8C565|nr:hypothetical protein [Dokdonella sp.]MBX3691781.1 hypothetical protein [Dokdonella sp.]MCW5566688.1 hypothetical protein [Dokdonella sp.]HNR90782.1 hypothetical protein [Dokdonella sp.]